MWPSLVAIDLTTTSPVFIPTRASVGRFPASRRRVSYRRNSSCGNGQRDHPSVLIKRQDSSFVDFAKLLIKAIAEWVKRPQSRGPAAI